MFGKEPSPPIVVLYQGGPLDGQDDELDAAEVPASIELETGGRYVRGELRNGIWIFLWENDPA